MKGGEYVTACNSVYWIRWNGKSSIAPELYNILDSYGYNPLLIRFDQERQSLAPRGADPFSADPAIKDVIYNRAIDLFNRHLESGRSLVIDAGLSTERIRLRLKAKIPELRIIHVTVPLVLGIARETERSFSRTQHERGRFLYARAIRDRLNPFLTAKDRFPQPPITYPFEFPACADLHVDTSRLSPRAVAELIVEKFRIKRIDKSWDPPLSA